MDLLGDIGTQDQLASTRAENAVLQKRVKELTAQVQELRVENECLKAEVEIYRKEAALPNFSNLALGEGGGGETKSNAEMTYGDDHVVSDAFVKSGDGSFPKENQITLPNLHGLSNPSCCALSTDDTVLATGGADSSLRLLQWGAAWTNDTNDDDAASAEAAATHLVQNSVSSVSTKAPVICTAFAKDPSLQQVVAAGSMDGALHLVQYFHPQQQLSSPQADHHRLQLHTTPIAAEWNHRKYVRAIAWADRHPILASASADGSVHVYKVEKPSALAMAMTDDDDDDNNNNSADKDLTVHQIQSLHLPGPVESLCFVENQLVCYARGTPHLSYFDLDQEFQQTTLNLNKTNRGAATGGFDDHVSFCVMDLQVCQTNPNSTTPYVAAATDTSRNLILDFRSGTQVRSLYGHQNDGFSQPKVAWSQNGSYLAGNTQDDSCLCVWDIASSRIVERLTAGHSSPIRDIAAGHTMDCFVTTAFDKQTKLWFAPAQ